MPGWMEVAPEDLQLSAATVDVHADKVALGHSAADGRIEAAQKGIPAASAAALGTAVTKWQNDTATLFRQLVDHSAGLRVGAACYQKADEQSASEIEAAGNRIPPEDMGI